MHVEGTGCAAVLTLSCGQLASRSARDSHSWLFDRSRCVRQATLSQSSAGTSVSCWTARLTAGLFGANRGCAVRLAAAAVSAVAGSCAAQGKQGENTSQLRMTSHPPWNSGQLVSQGAWMKEPPLPRATPDKRFLLHVHHLLV